jgi:hypothetical protein
VLQKVQNTKIRGQTKKPFRSGSRKCQFGMSRKFTKQEKKAKVELREEKKWIFLKDLKTCFGGLQIWHENDLQVDIFLSAFSRF